jgi:uncharacterized protein YndB with AHSA1/START domain
LTASCPQVHARFDAPPGGSFRYEWANGKGGGFRITGEFIELQPFTRIVHVERMHRHAGNQRDAEAVRASGG